MARSREDLELPVRAIVEIARRVGAHAGLRPPEWLVAARVRDRLRALRLGIDAYVAGLGGAELDTLTEALRVGETRFFRHQAHVGALERVVLPDLATRLAADQKLRAWSAGCANGEEAYTLAMLAERAMPAADGWSVDVLGTDISDEALGTARAGRYPQAALAQVPADAREAFFGRVDPATVSVRAELAERVRFERRNLLDPVYPRLRHLILCRNVLIYFQPEARERTVERLVNALAPGGYLFLGYAESLHKLASLEALRTEDGVVYRRPLAPRRPAPAKPTVRTRAASPRPATERHKPRRKPTEDTCRVVLSGAHDDPEAVLLDLRRAIAGNNRRIVVDLDGADFLADAIAPVLKRAEAAAGAAGVGFEILATRPGPRRWLSRHGLGERGA